ncbi:hypothetical protein BDR03DRAFT_1015767 [Suillus americanus]|nr:hypothetical protein BDR03DRAFT_1015767 [Suillus americanus]
MSSFDSLQKMEKYPHKKLTLDGSNYSQWATGFKMWASGIGLWSYVNSDKKEPSPPAILTDADQNIICKEKHNERVKVYKQYFVYLRDIDDLHIAWTALEKNYLPQKAIQFNQYLDRLFTIPKAHDSASIAETLQTLIVLQSDLAALSIASTTVPPTTSTTTTATTKGEYKIPDAISVHDLLQALPNYYDPLRQMLVNSDTSPDFSDIVNRPKTQELHCNGTNGTSDHVAMFSGH